MLAIRGTEPSLDGYFSGPADTQAYLDLYKADLHEIGVYGMAVSQAVSLFNYIQRLQTPEGQDAIQLEMTLSAREGATGRPGEVLRAMDLDPACAHIQRTKLIITQLEEN